MKLTLTNGNKKEYTTETDLMLCFYKPNSHVLERMETELGLKVARKANELVYFKAKNAMQVVKLLTWASTYSFKISYSNNASEKTTMYFHYADRPDGFFFTN